MEVCYAALAYKAGGVVGPNMQLVIDRGLHTAESLTAALMPKIVAQQSALQERVTYCCDYRNDISSRSN